MMLNIVTYTDQPFRERNYPSLTIHTDKALKQQGLHRAEHSTGLCFLVADLPERPEVSWHSMQRQAPVWRAGPRRLCHF